MLGIKIIVHTNHAALRYVIEKKDSNITLIKWVLLLKDLNIKLADRKGCKNQVADHLSRFDNKNSVDEEKEIADSFPIEHVYTLSLSQRHHGMNALQTILYVG